MTPRTQDVVLTMVGAIGLKLVLTDTYLHYVNAWMKWPIVLTSVLLVALSLRHLATDGEPASPEVPAATWLLVLPVLVIFVISPPALGAYAAERRAATTVPKPSHEEERASSHLGQLPVSEFVSLAQWEPPESLAGRTVVLTGFVSRGGPDADDWYVTRLGISCCAADALAWRVRVEGMASPPRDQWVRVTGTWVDPGVAVPRLEPPVVEADSLELVDAPAEPFE